MGIAESTAKREKPDPWWARPRVVFGFALADVVVVGLARRRGDATVAPTPSGVVVRAPRDGIVPNPDALRASLAHALLYHVERVVVPGRRVTPTVTVDALRHRYPSFITIDRGAFT